MKYSKKWLLISFGILIMVIGGLVILEDSEQIKQKATESYLPPVSVAKLQPRDNEGSIQVFAEVKPLWAATLRTQVSGEIVTITDKALAGENVKEGDLLIKIEDSPYRANLHEAEQTVSESKLSLLQEKKKSAQAEKDWKRSGIKTTPTDLALNKPQVDLATKAVKAAESRLMVAVKNYEFTKIRAPYSGYVTARHVSIGQAVAEGEELLHVEHDARHEIAVSLSVQQWGMLKEEWHNQIAIISNMSDVEIGRARIKRGGNFLDTETRQYKLFLEIDNTHKNRVLAGDFVKVKLPGRVASNSLDIPESALTRDGFIWYLDDDDRLRRFRASMMFHQDDRIVVKMPSSQMLGTFAPSSWRIATTPLASYLVGNLVRPVPAGSE